MAAFDLSEQLEYFDYTEADRTILAELRPLLEEQGLTVQISQLQAWRGQPLSDGTRLAPMNPTLILKGTKSHQ